MPSVKVSCSTILHQYLPRSCSFILIKLSDFRRRFLSLLSYEFAGMQPALALSILAYKPNVVLGDPPSTEGPFAELSDVKPYLDIHFSRFDIKRLGSFPALG